MRLKPATERAARAASLVLCHISILAAIPASIMPLGAQVSLGTGKIEGTVRDPSGAVVPNAQIEVRNTNTGVARTISADPAGRYSVLSLPVGDYEVRANAPGFRTTVQSGITLVIDRTALVDFNLTVGQVSETVSVTADAPLIESGHQPWGKSSRPDRFWSFR